MLGVVRYGTGTSAAIPGVKVAGKTGTAELEDHAGVRARARQPGVAARPEQQADPTDTDAWFAAYAPAGDGTPKVAVGVLLVRAGRGGDTAAPAARQVLLAAPEGARRPRRRARRVASASRRAAGLLITNSSGRFRAPARDLEEQQRALGRRLATRPSRAPGSASSGANAAGR